MSDQLTSNVLSGVFGVLAVVFAIFAATFSVFRSWTLWKVKISESLDETRYSQRHYGWAGVALSLGILETSSVVKKVRKYLLKNDVESMALFKQSFTESFNMIGVAGAITASIAITALSLPKLNHTHWTAYAAFIVSLTSGCLAVYYSCSTQLLLSGLHNPQEILLWLTKVDTRVLETTPGPADDMVAQVATVKNSRQRLPSLNAALMLVIPSHLLGVSLGSFVVGLGIYLGFLFGHHLDVIYGEGSDRAILIVYLVLTTGFVLAYGLPSLMKSFETIITQREIEQEAFELQESTQRQASLSSTRLYSIDNQQQQSDTNSVQGVDTVLGQEGLHVVRGTASVDTLLQAFEGLLRTQEDQLKATRRVITTLKSSA